MWLGVEGVGGSEGCGGRVMVYLYVLQAAVRAKNAGIHMMVLGVGGWTDESELMAIASYPQDRNYIRVRNYGDLRNFATRMADYLCNSE